MRTKFVFTVFTGIVASGSVFAQAAASMSAAEKIVLIQRQAELDFARLDRNGDGVVSREEARADRRYDTRFDAIDSNGDGKLSKEEILSYHAAIYARPRPNLLQGRLKAADTDGDNALTRSEAEAAHLTLLVKHFEKIDADKDGKVTPEELRAFLRNNRLGALM
jgi:Ca2+-binding EF-hand superfamily protein